MPRRRNKIEYKRDYDRMMRHLQAMGTWSEAEVREQAQHCMPGITLEGSVQELCSLMARSWLHDILSEPY